MAGKTFPNSCYVLKENTRSFHIFLLIQEQSKLFGKQ